MRVDETNSLSLFDGEGAFLQLVGESADMRYPEAVAVMADGSLVVCDTAKHRVVFFAPTGSVERCIGVKGSNNGKFKSPSALALHNASLFVLDYDSTRAQEFMGPQ